MGPRKQVTIVMAIAILFTLGGCPGQTKQSAQPTSEWKEDFLPFTDQILKTTSFAPLRGKAASTCDLNLRVWVGFGLKATEAYFIERNGHVWTGQVSDLL